MNYFSTKNFFDRLEATWRALAVENWKWHIIPFLIILGINIAAGMIFAVIIPLMVLGIGFSSMNGTEKIVWWIFLGVCAIIGVGVFYWITSNLTAITTYCMIEKDERRESYTPRSILMDAWGYIRHALLFDGYYYSAVALVVFVLFLLIFPVFQSSFWLIFGGLKTGILPDSISSWSSWDTLISFIGYFFLVLVVFIIFSMWFSVRYFTAKPGYILTKGESLPAFMDGKKISQGYFWEILGNIIAVWIIVSLITSLLNGFGGSASTPFLGTDTMHQLQDGDINALMSTLLTLVSPPPQSVGMILSILVGMCATVFRHGFSYILWRDLTTPVKNREKIGE